MLPLFRYVFYTLAMALCTGYFVWSEISQPGALNLLVSPGTNESLGTSEQSPLERIQPMMLLVCAGLYGWVARDCPSQRPIAFLFGGIAIAGAIREIDYLLDDIIADNAWQLPVGIIAALLIVYTWRNRRRFRIAWLRVWPSPGLTLLFAGAILHLVFAQLVGHEPLWRSISGVGYQRIVKLAVEEFIELFGYFFWLIGTLEYVFQARAVAKPEKLSAEARKRRSRPRGKGRY
ncbi:MAG: hypothetical protein R3315_11225 [Woeseiaceae bacterium]|nr:hypothetical protein [Woeseiaceae bacterium]